MVTAKQLSGMVRALRFYFYQPRDHPGAPRAFTAAFTTPHGMIVYRTSGASLRDALEQLDAERRANGRTVRVSARGGASPVPWPRFEVMIPGASVYELRLPEELGAETELFALALEEADAIEAGFTHSARALGKAYLAAPARLAEVETLRATVEAQRELLSRRVEEWLEEWETPPTVQ